MMARTRSRRVLMWSVVASLTLAMLAAGGVADAGHGPKPRGLEFLGQAIIPTGTVFQGTTVGGLSSITYDERRGVYYTVSDDPAAVRYYTVGVDLRDGRLSDGDVQFKGVTSLLAPGGGPYAPTSIDPLVWDDAADPPTLTVRGPTTTPQVLP